jgi:hypothetical protein
LTKGLFEAKVLIKITCPPDDKSQENGAKNDQEDGERTSWNLKPLMILPGKYEVKSDFTLILDGKNNRDEKGYYDKECLDPSHYLILLS